MTQTVIGFFDNSTEANEAVSKLVSFGISRDRIDVSGRRNDTDSNTGSSSRDMNNDDHENGITRFFKNLFGGEDDNVNKYSRVAHASEAIVTVHTQTEDEAEQAADILDDCGAVDVDEKASQFGYTDSSSTGYNNRMDSDNENQKVKVVEENIEVGKREVEKGSVRLRSRIVERPVEETVRLREERINVERRAVDRPATDADFNQFEEKDIEMVEHKEVPVVSKQARVVEEVSLNKEVDEREETVRNTVRNTEVDVERDEDRTTRDRY